MSKYRIYIDEVGNNDLASSENPNHRYLSLTGVIFELDYIKKIVQPKLEDPAIEKRFNSDFLTLITNLDFKIISVLIDKFEHNLKYNTWKYDPYHYCMEIIVERYFFFLEKINSVGDVMIESRGGKEDMRLKKSFRNIWEKWTHFVEANKLHPKLSSRELKVKPKTLNISGLQIADLIAHPARRFMFRKYNIKEGKRYVFGNAIIRIIENKFYSGVSGIEGYGIKFLP